MLTLFLILIVTAVSLTVLLWAGSTFFQGYIYTEPSAGIFWQAPAAAGLLTFGFLIWSLTIAFWSGASRTNIPVKSIFFSPKVYMVQRPVKYIWATTQEAKKDGKGKTGEPVKFECITGFDGMRQTFQYKRASDKQGAWPSNVVAIDLEKDADTKIRFKHNEGNTVTDYREYYSDDGWTLRDYSGDAETGKPFRYRFSLLFVNVLFNLGHLAGWFIALWLVLRFQWPHALGLAVVLWLVTALLFMPILLEYAADVAESRQVRAALDIGFQAIG